MAGIIFLQLQLYNIIHIIVTHDYFDVHCFVWNKSVGCLMWHL